MDDLTLRKKMVLSCEEFLVQLYLGSPMSFENYAHYSFLRRKEVEARTGLARSTIYKMVSAGEFPAPVRIFGAAVGWPSNEVDAITAARIAGKSPHEVRELVALLQTRRQQPIQSGDAPLSGQSA